MISIVVPVFNGMSSLPQFIDRVGDVSSQLERKHEEKTEIIFVDDGSTDDSIKVIREHARKLERVRLIRLSRNFGAVAASREGLRHASGDTVSILACDLQDPPELLEKMLDLKSDDVALVVAVRRTRSDPWKTRFFSRLFYWLFRKFVDPSFPRGGFDIFLLESRYKKILTDGAKGVFPSVLLNWAGLPRRVIEYDRPARHSGRSGWSLKKRFDAVLTIFIGFTPTPLRLATVTGLGMSALMTLYGLWLGVNVVLGQQELQGFATVIALLGVQAGLTLATFGILGEYVWRLVLETNRRPEVVVTSAEILRD